MLFIDSTKQGTYAGMSKLWKRQLWMKVDVWAGGGGGVWSLIVTDNSCIVQLAGNKLATTVPVT